MPADVVLVDTGPLVALFDPSDADREPCRQCLASLGRAVLATTEAVITEAEYLLGFSSAAQASLQALLASGRPCVEAIMVEDRPRIATLLRRYADLPMDYADATLVVLAGRLGTTRVFTLDRRDFSVYRVGRRGFCVIP